MLPVIWSTPRLRGLWEKTGNAGALRWQLTHRGPVASNVAESGGFAHSEPGLPAPDLQLHVLAAAYKNQGLADPVQRAMTVLVGLIDVKSRGRIRLRSADPRHRPAIDPGYLSDGGGDARALLAGLKLAREFVTARPMAAICRSEIAPGAHVRSDAELLDYVKNNVVTLYHPVGTCAMGSEARWGSVLDPELKVRGIDGLRVVDASVMPTVPRGNTNAPTIAIAERAADLIAGRAPLAPADPADPVDAMATAGTRGIGIGPGIARTTVTISADTQITDLTVNDHACLTFGEPEELFDLTAAFVRDGLDGGLKVVWLSDATPDRATAELARRGIVVDEALASGQLVAASYEGRLLAGQVFSAGQALTWLAARDGHRRRARACDWRWT